MKAQTLWFHWIRIQEAQKLWFHQIRIQGAVVLLDQGPKKCNKQYFQAASRA